MNDNNDNSDFFFFTVGRFINISNKSTKNIYTNTVIYNS